MAQAKTRRAKDTTRAAKPPRPAASKPPKVDADLPSDADILEDEVKKLPVPSTAAPSLPSTREDRDLLALYLKEVSKHPLLSPEREKELALEVFEHKDRVAFQELVQSNLRFVVKIAFEYSRYGARVLDLIQEGNVGLLRAISDFNPYKDVRLTTYAVWWIRSYIQDYLMRNWSMVRVGTTAAQKKLFYRLRKEQEKFEREGLVPQARAIAMNLNVNEDDVKTMQERMSGRDLSLSAPTGGSESESAAYTLTNRVADSAPLAPNALEASEQAELFKRALEEFKDELDEREQTIFRERLLSENPRTLLEIGNEYGFTKERARQLEERIKKKLKEFLAKYYPDISIS
jgi:RNA polymerase sigma-32 factor